MTPQARDRILALSRERGGLLTPDQVIEEARDEASPLHEYFEWDDQLAAQQARVYTARNLIRSVRVDYRTETKVVTSYAFTHDPRVPAGEQGYIEVEAVRKDEDLAREVLMREFAMAAAALQRAATFADVFELTAELEAFVERLHLLRGTLKKAA